MRFNCAYFSTVQAGWWGYYYNISGFGSGLSVWLYPFWTLSHGQQSVKGKHGTRRSYFSRFAWNKAAQSWLYINSIWRDYASPAITTTPHWTEASDPSPPHPWIVRSLLDHIILTRSWYMHKSGRTGGIGIFWRRRQHINRCSDGRQSTREIGINPGFWGCTYPPLGLV